MFIRDKFSKLKRFLHWCNVFVCGVVVTLLQSF
jgi:hypothetical protein